MTLDRLLNLSCDLVSSRAPALRSLLVSWYMSQSETLCYLLLLTGTVHFNVAADVLRGLIGARTSDLALRNADSGVSG